MPSIFVNLKRFEVPRALGGVCDVTPAKAWIESVLADCVARRLGAGDGDLVFFLPEALLLPALDELARHDSGRIAIGCQGVYRDDIRPGGNFGAFTGNRPATAMAAAGVSWVLVGHSETRKDKLGIIDAYAAARGEAADPAEIANPARSICIT